MKITDNFLSESDECQLKERGISKTYVFHQKFIIQRGTVHLDIVDACLRDKGVIYFEEHRKEFFKKIFLKNKKNYKIVKFVPSSGAASRMFSDLDINTKKDFFLNLNKFAFYNILKEYYKNKGLNLKDVLDECKYEDILSTLLNENGLNYINMPKALIPFHFINNKIVTAFEEQIEESIETIADVSQKSYFHFTISKQNESIFQAHLDKINKNDSFKDIIIDVSFSYQSFSTDTIAVDSEGEFVRDFQDKILFRPGGHGALLQNLNELGKKFDIIWVKNIDNISVSKYHNAANDSFSLLTGYLIYVQEQIFSFLKKLTEESIIEEDLIKIKDFCVKTLFYFFPENFDEMNFCEKKEYIIKRLNRPIRICGLVFNEGETGGLPFLVRDKHKEISLQIVESAEINKNDINYQNLIKNSVYFNPVFMVLSMKSFNNTYFDITHFTSKDAFIISEKTFKGKKIKVLEHPGLWNGGMYYWNTIFIEMPKDIFSPVKTVMDLLREEHKG